MKHKHKWQFVKEIGGSYVPGFGIHPSHWTDRKFIFVCECGEVKNVKEKV